MQLISRYNKEFGILLCGIDNFSKYAWAVPLKDKKVIAITNTIWKILDESNSKLNKLWVDKSCDFKIEPLRTIK